MLNLLKRDLVIRVAGLRRCHGDIVRKVVLELGSKDLNSRKDQEYRYIATDTVDTLYAC